MEYEGNQIILKNPTWWERRTDLERRVMIVTFILFLLTVGLIICILAILLRTEDYEQYYQYRSDYDMMMPIQEFSQTINDPNHLICMEPGCIHSAAKIVSFLDTSVDPCNNFYKFACGGFLNTSHIAEGKTSVTAFDINQRMVDRQLKTIFEEPVQYKDIKPVALVKKLYSLCMDTESIERDNLDSIKTIIRHLGGWPVLEGYTWNENEFDWKHAVFKMRRMGLNANYLISLNVVPDSMNSSHHMLELDQAFIEPEEELFLSGGTGNEFLEQYFSYMVDVAVLFGADLTFAANEMKTALEFEVALAKISNQIKKESWNSSILFNTMTIGQMQSMYPHVAWLEYINGVIDMPEYKVSFGDQIIVRVPQYLADFENILRWTSKRVVANYLMWRTVKYSANYLTAVLRDRQAAFYRNAYALDNRESRWRECVNLVSSRMPFAVGFIYVERHVMKETKEVLFEMVTNIRNQVIELLKAVDWMDDMTRVNAFDKAESMTIHTAYSGDFLSVKRLQRYYSQLEFTRNYLKSVLNLSLFKKDKYYKKMHKYVINSEWEESDYSVGVRPYYSVTKNKLDIPNGILQGIFFSTDKPQYFNYGALGNLIGHEISHGFDDIGRQFDKNGNPLDWWSEFTKRAFMKKARCLNSQNRNHSMPEIELYMNDINNHEINFANQGGIKAAYSAYNAWVERYGYEFQLPSLHQLTPHQLFWVSAAQTQCERYHPNWLKQEGFSELQTPAQSALHEALSNIEYFSRDFHCHLGSPMNPARKCHVW